MSDIFHQVSKQLRAAKNATDLFGMPGKAELQRRYHTFAAVVHPDHNPDRQQEATELFILLQRLYQEAIGRHAPLVIETRRKHYVSVAPPLHGDLADVYPAAADGERVLLKIARDPRGGELMQAEASTLETIERSLAGQKAHAHFPTLVERALVRDASGNARWVHVFAHDLSNVSLAAVLRAYPRGLDLADAAWMFNRLLAALGLAHDQGIVHGAVLPAHLLIRPGDHNGMLIDWSYSVPTGEPVRAISPAQRAEYPPEVLAKQPATPATDLYMAARLMSHLLGGAGGVDTVPPGVPKPVRALLASCLIPAPARRPNDAWQLLDDFRALLAELYGPPRFQPFVMP